MNVKQGGRKEGTQEKDEQEMKPYKLMVFLGIKTMVCLFLKPDTTLTVKTLNQLNIHLTKQVPILS
jgi:hypothetical protein